MAVDSSYTFFERDFNEEAVRKAPTFDVFPENRLKYRSISVLPNSLHKPILISASRVMSLQGGNSMVKSHHGLIMPLLSYQPIKGLPKPRRASIAAPGASTHYLKFGSNTPTHIFQIDKSSSLEKRPIKQSTNNRSPDFKRCGSATPRHTTLYSVPSKTTLGLRRASLPCVQNYVSGTFPVSSKYGTTKQSNQMSKPHSVVAIPNIRNKLPLNSDVYETDSDYRIIHPKRSSTFEGNLLFNPVHDDSLSKLRARTQLAKDHLSRHKILLDRYLPIHLGAETDVVQEVESRYGELLSRMPHLIKPKPKEDDEYCSPIPPYKPAPANSKKGTTNYEIQSTPVKKSFTSKISDTRKRARSVLCKVKGDPHYFDFQ